MFLRIPPSPKSIEWLCAVDIIWNPIHLQVGDEFRIAAHERAGALVGRRMLVIVEEHLQVNVTRIGGADELHQLEIARLRVHAEPLADQRLAGERNVDIVLFRGVQGAFVVACCFWLP